MSTASHVKETWELTGDDARETLASTGRMTLLKDAVVRLRAADGTSHSRGLAFAVSLVLVQGLVVVVGFAVATGSAGFRQLLLDTINASAPGPTSDLLTNAVEQATRVGRQHRYLPLTIGLIGTIVTATIAMGQLERAMNRIYGVEKDRPFAQKYKRALALALSAGVVIAAAFALLTFGRGLVDDGAARSAWMVLRWPLGIALVAAGLAVLFNWAPRRRQPGWPWLAFGAWVSVAGWTLVTAALALVFNVSKTFGETYGSLAGLVALQLWTFFSALAILYGVAVAAQLEAVRAGVPEAQDLSKDEMTVAEPALRLSRAASRRGFRARLHRELRGRQFQSKEELDADLVARSDRRTAGSRRIRRVRLLAPIDDTAQARRIDPVRRAISLELDADADDGDAVDLARELVEAAFLEPGRLLAFTKRDDDPIGPVLRDRVEHDLIRRVGLDVHLGRLAGGGSSYRFADLAGVRARGALVVREPLQA